MQPSHNPIICALDTTNVARARALCEQLRPHVGAVKLGLEFFTANGAQGIHDVVHDNGIPVFLDLKFHDIPNTVAGAIRATAGIHTFMMTVHALGGRDMLRAAMDASMEIAAETGKERPLIVGVTILTSMDQDDLQDVGIDRPVQDQVRRLANLVQEAGLDGVVCSPFEITALREQCGADFTLVIPGIRPEGSDNGDQKRVLTPREAIARGASHLVIGRPITAGADPAQAARAIVDTL
jgi:orotidine-5'-phosphate decarboxylase